MIYALHRRLLLGSVFLLSLMSNSTAQTFPTGPVKIITQQAAGGGTDPAMRVVADQLSKLWHQQAVVVNQPGAGGAIAARAAASAIPDGHTLYMAIASTFIALPEIQTNLPFDVADFIPIGFVGEVPITITVAQSLPANSLSELVALSHAQQAGLTVAIPNRGGIPHLTAELFRSRAGANMTYVFYPGSAQALSDVISGRVPVLFEGLGGPVNGPQLKILAIGASARLPSRSNLATISETFPGFAAAGWTMLVAPAGTPDWVVSKIRDDLYTVLGQPEVKQKFEDFSISIRPMSSEQMRAFIASERQLWKPVVKQIGLAAQ